VCLTYPVIGWRNRPGFPRYLNTPPERLGTCHPSAGFILSRSCAAMGYGPNRKRCSSGLQRIPRLILPCVHSLPIANARVVHSVLHRNIPGHTRVFHRSVPSPLHRKSTGFSTESSTGFPQSIHWLSTGCRPNRPQATSRRAASWPEPRATPPPGCTDACSPSEGHEMPNDPAEAGVMAPAMVRRRGI
jgi:hypothetical protein